MIALYHKHEGFEGCSVRKPEKLDELLALAQPGDSLHNVSDEITGLPVNILQAVREQRKRGEGKQL